MRAKMPHGIQQLFFQAAKDASRLNWEELARFCGKSSRTLCDWYNERYLADYEIVQKLSHEFKIQLPTALKTLPDYWYVVKGSARGSRRRYELYGPLGTQEGRRKGGIISQQRRRAYPEKYLSRGCIVRKSFPCLEPSEEFAELTGIILGDGSITKTQLRITLNSKVDRAYAIFARKLMRNVLKELPSWREYNDNVITLTISGVDLIEKLSACGLPSGNKVVQQIKIPHWVWKKPLYLVACVRGLIDTDGGLYFHNHTTNGLRYRNIGLNFTNASRPLLHDVAAVLKKLDIRFSTTKNGTRIFIYDLKEIQKYFRIINSHNPKHLKKLEFHLSTPRRLS